MQISAVIPVYNGKKYLRKAIESVINQTLRPIELILVDDGSSDNSIEEIRQMEYPFPVQFIKQDNAGQAAARNRGILAAKGDFIALLDQDDFWYANHLEILSNEFKDHPHLGWAYSNIDEWDEKGRLLKKSLLDHIAVTHPKKDIIAMLGEDLHILPSASLIRKKALVDIGLFDKRFSGYEDDDLFLRMFLGGWDNTYINTPLSTWRIHASSSGHSSRMHESRKLFAQKMIELFHDIELNRFCVKDILGRRFFELYFKAYKKAMLQKDYDKCYSYLPEIRYYFSLMNPAFQKKWKMKTMVMQYPKLTRFLYKVLA